MSMPAHVVQIAVEPNGAADREKLSIILARLAREDSSHGATFDEVSGQVILHGRDDYHLASLVDQLRQEGVQMAVGAPQVAYRETLAGPVEVDYTHKRQSGGSGQFGRVRIMVAPGEPGQGMVFVDRVSGGNVPADYIPSVEQGIRDAAATGSLIGFPIVDVTVTLTDGAYHGMDSSPLAFENAGRGAMREAVQKAGIKLLEPVMKLAIVTPRRWIRLIKADLASRRARIDEVKDGDPGVIVAAAPMASLFGYAAALNTISRGEARFAMLPDHYAEVPPNLLGPDDSFPAAAALRA